MELIRLKEGEKVSVDQQVEGFTIEGPATVIIIKEKTAAKATEHPYGDSNIGFLRSEPQLVSPDSV